MRRWHARAHVMRSSSSAQAILPPRPHSEPMLSCTSTFACGSAALRSQPRSPRRVASRIYRPPGASTEWILDLPRATAYREMEGSGSAERKTTAAPLQHAKEGAPSNQEMEKVPPINVSQLLEESKAPQIVVGTRAAYEEAKKEWKDWDAPLAVDLTSLAGDASALAALSVDRFGELYIEDMAGPHMLHVDGQGVGKGEEQPRGVRLQLRAGLQVTR